MTKGLFSSVKAVTNEQTAFYSGWLESEAFLASSEIHTDGTLLMSLLGRAVKYMLLRCQLVR